jgi:hypothetical protein
LPENVKSQPMRGFSGRSIFGWVALIFAFLLIWQLFSKQPTP